MRECATDEIGTLLISGPAVFPGYLRDGDNAKVWAAPGWLNTGDLCRIDRDGYVWLTGRAKDLIIRGGHNIDPQLIEDALVTHPAVAMAAAVGQPDAYAGELPMAYVALRPGTSVSLEELVAHCREHIPERAAVPVRIVILATLPLTAVGKTFKPELRWRAIEHVLTAGIGGEGHRRQGERRRGRSRRDAGSGARGGRGSCERGARGAGSVRSCVRGGGGAAPAG